MIVYIAISLLNIFLHYLGVVDIIPLAHHNDLEVFVRKSNFFVLNSYNWQLSLQLIIVVIAVLSKGLFNFFNFRYAYHQYVRICVFCVRSRWSKIHV